MSRFCSKWLQWRPEGHLGDESMPGGVGQAHDERTKKPDHQGDKSAERSSGTFGTPLSWLSALRVGAPVVVRRVNPDGTPTWEKAGTLVRLWWNRALGRYEAEVAYSEAPAIRFVYVLTPGATRWKAPVWGEAALVPVEGVEFQDEPGADGAS